MNTLAFIGNSEPPAKLLDIFRKMTPGRSGVWGQLRGVDNYADADYFSVIDRVPSGTTVDVTRCVFLGAHPPGIPAYRDMSNCGGLRAYDCAETFGFGEWWLHYDYDYLSGLTPPAKPKTLACIMSNANTRPYHHLRRAYLERFCQKHGAAIEVYGRITPSGAVASRHRGSLGSTNSRANDGNDHMSGKELVYLQHKYALEFDAPAKYYFSERIFDCLLTWCIPIYWGCDNLQDFIPAGSFCRLDVGRDGDDVMDIINSGIYEQRIQDIALARDLLLNRYQIWPRTHEAIFGVPK